MEKVDLDEAEAIVSMSLDNFAERVLMRRLIDEVRISRGISSPRQPARLLRECVVCGEKVTVSNATEEWEAQHRHASAPRPFPEARADWLREQGRAAGG